MQLAASHGWTVLIYGRRQRRGHGRALGTWPNSILLNRRNRVRARDANAFVGAATRLYIRALAAHFSATLSHHPFRKSVKQVLLIAPIHFNGPYQANRSQVHRWYAV